MGRKGVTAAQASTAWGERIEAERGVRCRESRWTRSEAKDFGWIFTNDEGGGAPPTRRLPPLRPPSSSTATPPQRRPPVSYGRTKSIPQTSAAHRPPECSPHPLAQQVPWCREGSVPSVSIRTPSQASSTTSSMWKSARLPTTPSAQSSRSMASVKALLSRIDNLTHLVERQAEEKHQVHEELGDLKRAILTAFPRGSATPSTSSWDLYGI
eukprot:Sspe_Gene.100159::Locus_74882_Transcript_1_1_Confidence_1.000_Length_1086::g.100159::m.100159